MTLCKNCGATDEGTKIQYINDVECKVCTVCEAEESVGDVEFEAWMHAMELEDVVDQDDEDFEGGL